MRLAGIPVTSPVGTPLQQAETHKLKDTLPLSRVEPISMRVNDACRFIGIGRSTLYLLIGRGEIEIIKLGATTLVVTESLREFIARRRKLS